MGTPGARRHSREVTRGRPGRLCPGEPSPGGGGPGRRTIRRRDGSGHRPRTPGPGDGGGRRRGPPSRHDRRGAGAPEAGLPVPAGDDRGAATEGTVTAGNAPGITDGAAATGSPASVPWKTSPSPRWRGSRLRPGGGGPRWLFMPPWRASAARGADRDPDRGLRPRRDQRGLRRPGPGRRAGPRLRLVQGHVNGGAIALVHPIGASGARIVATLLHELRRREGRYGLATLCLGGGGSVAMAFERA